MRASGELMRRHCLDLLSSDLLLIGLATVFADAIRENFEITHDSFTLVVPYVLLTLAVTVPILTVSVLNRTIWRLSVLSDYVRVVIEAIRDAWRALREAGITSSADAGNPRPGK
jgi:hypothetical protein